ncbi:uncharacterized protein F5147DRAFT_652284 [Suillus discolor]|uniref:Uncharacterized protein n=1 Tax=Suillus discolor TaxID=1912936 RepID=A0A9P7F7I9_9AGAM|nr:uncharacterized protein F5147DRAFT_652284 [Suillus discolor]KAG2109694.1 hypothetical protein F5147DRAFT_652284 [Suillus discolor]
MTNKTNYLPCTALTRCILATWLHRAEFSQYTQFVALLQRAEDAWAQKIQQIGCVVTEEKLGRVSLDEIEGQVDEQDVLLVNTVHTVFANYAAAQCRVRQYTHFLTILKREEDAWLQRFQKACSVMLGYEPASLSHYFIVLIRIFSIP